MSKVRYPFALRLIGYSPDQRSELNQHFTLHHRQGGSAFHALHEDNLVDPDIYLVNVDDPLSLLALERLRPAPARPALLVGSQPVDLPHLFMPVPDSLEELTEGLEKLIQMRADAFARLPASELVHVPERRRPMPVGLSPAEAVALRRVPLQGGVLVVDRDAGFCHALGKLLGQRQIRVDRANEERSAVILARQLDVSLVFINTATPALDPYRLCEEIRSRAGEDLPVIFLVGRYFNYQAEWARAAGCAGFVNKPVSERQLASLLERYLPSVSSSDDTGQ